MYFKTSAGKKAIKLMLNSTLDKLDYKKPSIPFLFDDNGESV